LEYSIFGPAGSPSEDFLSDLRELSQLDHKQLGVISDWFLASKNYDPLVSPLPATIVASTLLPEQFQQAAQCLSSLLWAWQEYGLQITDIERDLLLLGVSLEALAAIAPFLDGLSKVRKRVWAFEYARLQTFEGLPTMENVGFTCEARAVFGGFPVGDAQVQGSYRAFLGLTPIVIMEIVASDGDGNEERTAIQLSEENLERLYRAIGRVREQMSILKERTAAVAFNGGEL
jgi:hypothetical protein